MSYTTKTTKNTSKMPINKTINIHTLQNELKTLKKENERLQNELKTLKNERYHKENPNGIYLIDDCWNLVKEYLGFKEYYIPKYFPQAKLFKPVKIKIEYFNYHYDVNLRNFIKRTKKCLANKVFCEDKPSYYLIEKDSISEYVWLKIYGYSWIMRPDFKIYTKCLNIHILDNYVKLLSPRKKVKKVKIEQKKKKRL